MIGWDVRLDGEVIDTVFYDSSYTTADDVKRSLVNHDGYDANIEVDAGGCECEDKLCPCHTGRICEAMAVQIVRRIDFDGQPVCRFCDACAEDAISSGVFA
jgi:hypothetical protein